MQSRDIQAKLSNSLADYIAFKKRRRFSYERGEASSTLPVNLLFAAGTKKSPVANLHTPFGAVGTLSLQQAPHYSFRRVKDWPTAGYS